MEDSNKSFDSSKTPEFYEDITKDDTKCSIIDKEFLKDRHLICLKCENVPKIEFESYDKIKIACLCSKEGEKTEIKNKSIEELLNSEYLKNYNNNNLHPFPLKCQIHHQIFAYYCKECQKNICSSCVVNIDEHIDHHLELLAIQMNKNKKYIDYIKEKIEELEIESKEKELEIESKEMEREIESKEKELKIESEVKKLKIEFKEKKNFILLMNIIINDYESYPNNSHYYIFQNCIKFLDNIIIKINNN